MRCRQSVSSRCQQEVEGGGGVDALVMIEAKPCEAGRVKEASFDEEGWLACLDGHQEFQRDKQSCPLWPVTTGSRPEN